MELESIALVELGHELDPMETERVQEALHDVHNHQDTQSGSNENEETHEHHQDAGRLEAGHQSAVVEDLSELGVSE